jgi:Fe(3+) dicitrate transport protein
MKGLSEVSNVSIVSNVYRFGLVSAGLALLFIAPLTVQAEPEGTLTASGSAQEVDADSSAGEQPISDNQRTYRITVVGSKDRESILPGSAYLLDEQELSEAKGGADDVHRVLRRIPGVNIQEEDGYGLRPNIGLRGAPSERSSSITLMEDGVLAAPAPYSAPAAYYFPTLGRMEAIEVLKGASQIKYGPFTTGGSLNMLSTSIPQKESLSLRYQAGQDSAQLAHVHLGKSFEYGGFLLETYQASSDGFKELDGGGDTGFAIEDYIGKFRLNTGREAELYQELEFKVGYYDQDSDETYLGLTDDDFHRTPFRRYAGSQLDNIAVRHKQFQVTHHGELTSNLNITTTAYTNRTARNWEKLESVGGTSISAILADSATFSDELDWIKGATSPDGALRIRGNNRGYRASGIQSALAASLEHGAVKHALEFGARFHEDYEDRFQAEDSFRMQDGRMILTEQGKPGSNANRVSSADAWAFYLQDELSWQRLTLTPGVRYEYIDYTREDYGREDPTRDGFALKRSTNSVSALVPGLGANYALTDSLSIFTGIHRGFAPPGPVGTSDVRKEESINYEVGMGYFGSAIHMPLVIEFYVFKRRTQSWGAYARQVFTKTLPSQRQI